jgi:hypothetical protein
MSKTALFSSLPRMNLLNKTSGARNNHQKMLECEKNARKFERKIWSVLDLDLKMPS